MTGQFVSDQVGNLEGRSSRVAAQLYTFVSVGPDLTLKAGFLTLQLLYISFIFLSNRNIISSFAVNFPFHGINIFRGFERKLCPCHFLWLHVIFIIHTSMLYEPRHEKSDFCLCENKGTDQLRSNCEADQHLCFRYTDNTFPLLSKSKISSL